MLVEKPIANSIAEPAELCVALGGTMTLVRQQYQHERHAAPQRWHREKSIDTSVPT